MKKIARTACMFLISMTFFVSCQKSPSQMNEENVNANSSASETVLSQQSSVIKQSPTPNMSPSTEASSVAETAQASPVVKHITKTIEGKVNKLNIDLDITDYSGQEFGVYDANPMQVDHEAWFNYFFKGIDRNSLTHYYDGWGQNFLDKQEVTEELKKNTFAFIYGDIHKPEKQVFYIMNNSRFTYILGNKVLSLKEKCTLKADESLQKEAESLSNSLMDFVAGDRLYFSSCEIGQSENGNNAVYVSKYSRSIEGLPILLDLPFVGGVDEIPEPVEIDNGNVYVVNGEIVYASAAIRELTLRERTSVISVDQALNILETYVDTVTAYTQEYMDGKSKICEFNIKRAELMYYPVTIEDSSLANTYMGKHACATYRPVWCFASGQREHSNFVYAMVIDAITGKVIA